MTALSFEVTREGGVPPGAHLRVYLVERDEHGIRINYKLVPVAGMSGSPTGEGEDDLGNVYDDRGGAFGPAPDGTAYEGVLTMPLPETAAQTVHVRLRWDSDVSPHELRIDLD